MCRWSYFAKWTGDNQKDTNSQNNNAQCGMQLDNSAFLKKCVHYVKYHRLLRTLRTNYGNLLIDAVITGHSVCITRKLVQDVIMWKKLWESQDSKG